MLLHRLNGCLRVTVGLALLLFLSQSLIAPPARADSPERTPARNLTLSDPVSRYRPASDGAQRTSSDQPAPRHAYSPFDDPEPAPPPPLEAVPGQVLVKFKASAMSVTRSGGAQPGSALLKRLGEATGVSQFQRVFAGTAAPTTRSAAGTLVAPELARWYRAVVPDGADVTGVAVALTRDAAIEVAEPEYIRRPALLPDATTDPRIGEQWHLDAINAPAAWQFLADNGIEPGGRREIVVAVIDTGVDYTHPDLAGNMWTNAREVPGNGIDDDSNGFVDDIHGVNVVSNQHSGNPMDDHGHGTHVAGIIAAQAGNGGIVGVAYNTQIMAIKAAQYSGVLSTTDIAEAIYYAVENGADVINMSFGGYFRSQIEEDALAVAFGQAVLVAAAGNDGLSNEFRPNVPLRPMYPAAYNWVLGVMASTPTGALAPFTNVDPFPDTLYEYELSAPGVDVLSTLPGGQYAFWDGTSMAAPVVSGIAALLRSYFWDKDVYSSRFIMGQIASQGANAYASLTEVPKPELKYLEHWLFDTAAQAAVNDDDGIVDAGETVELAIVIRNQWGKADNVNVNLRAYAPGAFQDDPFVTFDVDTVNYGAVGSFNWDDNGLLYDPEGAITGVDEPFRFTVSPDAYNDHVIPFLLTMTCTNGLDPTDSTVYTFESRFNLIVQRGRELPRIISEDMTLTSDYYWIIPDQTLIEANAAVTVEEGTQVQFWTASPSDPYSQDARTFLQVEGTLLVQGTADAPVELFPDAMFPLYAVDIRRTEGGSVEFSYARVLNPRIVDANVVDHSYFTQDVPTWLRYAAGMLITSGSPLVLANVTSNSIFHRLGGPSWEAAALPVNLSPTGSLYDSNVMLLYPSTAENNVFLKNMRTDPMAVSRSFLRTSSPEQFRNNAILNVWWDPNPDHWMIFDANGTGRGSLLYLSDNFWGTTSTTIIDATIYDYNDNFNLGQYVYQPILTVPAETTYPFVWKVEITQGGQPTTILGPGEAVFTVTFNRDMDVTKQPQVSFGPDVPMTDYTLHPIGGGWQDARTWAGTFNINPITGDGYQLMRVARAVAADDPWLVTGDDTGRFRFEIITSGTEAMNLQAIGAEGRVDLAWAQDDFDLLIGYNLYRSESAQGQYTRLNTTVIPTQQKAYTDRNVQPGRPYFYKFTVVKSNLTESDFSNTASGTPLDTIPPVIIHTPVTSSPPGLGLQIYADVTDNVRVASVDLKHRRIGETLYQTREMVNTTGSRYSATLDGSLLTAPGLEYYIVASDGISPVKSGHESAPHRVNVVDRPRITAVSPGRGPIAGGTEVTISGTNFKPGLSVTFGDAAAETVTLVSGSQINCVTPPHAPGAVDVSVINPDEASDTLLRGFVYESNQASLSLPDMQADTNAVVEVALSVEDLQGLFAADVEVRFDPAVLTWTGVRTGTLTAGFSLDSNSASPGQVRLSMASATAASGSGTLVVFEFLVTGVPSATTELVISEASLNDGAIPLALDNGMLVVSDLLNVSGNVLYYQDNRPVSGVVLTLSGSQLFSTNTDETGAFRLANVPTGAYVLTAAKSDEADGITAYDASLILRHASGSLPLSGHPLTAADVNRNGAVTSMDASYVLQKAVGLINVPFPGAGKVWDFVPAQREYSPLAADATGQDFTTILIGDVSGNWHVGGTQSAQVKAVPTASLFIPDVPVSPQGQVTAPLVLDTGGAQVYSADLTVTYDPAKVSVTGVVTSPSSDKFSLAVNLNQPGVARIAIAAATPLPHNGELVNITFAVGFAGSGVLPVGLSVGSLNEGAVSAALWDGSITVAAGRVMPGLARAGNIRFAPRAYEDWQVNLDGEYRGWEPADGAPPVNRSDWVIRDTTGAVYVSGAAPMKHPDDLGKSLSITGIVRVKEGQAYIEVPRQQRR